MTTCNHNDLIVDGGTMVRRTDNRGRPLRLCTVCGFNPAAPTPRDRGDNHMLTAVAHATAVNHANFRPVDVLMDMDAD